MPASAAFSTSVTAPHVAVGDSVGVGKLGPPGRAPPPYADALEQPPAAADRSVYAAPFAPERDVFLRELWRAQVYAMNNFITEASSGRKKIEPDESCKAYNDNGGNNIPGQT